MLKFTKMTLDRCSTQRKDSAWTKKQMLEAGFLILCEDKNLVYGNTYQPIILNYKQIVSFSLESSTMVFLGYSSHPLYAIDVTDMKKVEDQLLELGQFSELRQVASRLDNDTASALMLSRGLCHWHRNNRFCGRCGHPTGSIEAGNALVCSGCNHQTFPRTDPVVIMLVTKQFEDGIERVLLGRHKHRANDVYTCLAGYVDQCETLEQAVQREVFEESGIRVDDVHYVASQPWLFPSSLMLGFTAHATTDQINVDKDELDTADWFSRDELVRFSEREDGCKLPNEDTIARYLIEQWIQMTPIERNVS
ncbi:NAD(+) diphosphatase [Vibrio sp. YYF0003]|uniref:NAD(+) diphosphatase n=1 Tax=Vibrio sp. YYF0003 TaxID=3116646 RepID=UPI002EB38CE7|nr:NAD(+) diphosphatase [Vibrio sp. YYF0003]